jgi:hypothetical protein
MRRTCNGDQKMRKVEDKRTHAPSKRKMKKSMSTRIHEAATTSTSPG